MCNELADTGSSTFDGELRKIIYTHVPEEQRIGLQSLDDLLDFKIAELEAERQQLANKLSKVNSELAGLEHQLSASFRQSLEQQLDTKKKELVALNGAAPAPVDDPLESDAAKQETAAATERLSELEAVLDSVRTEEQHVRKKKAEAVKGAAHAMRILQAIKNYQKTHDQFFSELGSMLAEVNTTLKASDIVALKINMAPIEQLGSAFKQVSDAQEVILSGDDDTSLFRKREVAEAEIKTIKSQLSEKQRLFLVYKDKLAQWQRAKTELQGDENKRDTIAWYAAQVKALDALPAKREQLRGQRREIVCCLHEQIVMVVREYRTLYQPVQQFVQSAMKMEMSLPLDFNVRIAEEGFQERFFAFISRQTRGSFSGIDESHLLMRGILKETDFMNADAVVAFVDKIDDFLHFDRRGTTSNLTELSVANQLRKGTRPEEVYNYLFGLDYLKPQYSLTYDGQEISQLSPGERGMLLLVFYLLVDNDDIPLIIDQPEENLDNQTIYKVLVKCIKAAKQCRQVIIVTHNPNLAVVCDAEQIIYATCDKANKCFSYLSGAIESPQIKAQVIEILEGTKPAFINRKKKYGF